MITAIQNLAEKLPLEEHYTWEIPANVPINIPQEITGAFNRNIYLKEHLAKKLESDDLLEVHYWIIREWGGIKTFQVCKRNNQKIDEFRKQLTHNRLQRSTFNLISSLSKLASFWNPMKYSIYDSRAIFSLNWLIFRYSESRQLFPQPIGRSSAVSMYDTATLFRLSDIEYSDRHWQTAYHEYCELLRHLAKDALNTDRPYYVEMLLFVAASKLIVEDICSNTKVQINTKTQQFTALDF